jgi:hypothetical protein
VRRPQDRSTINEYMVNLNDKRKVRDVYRGFHDGDSVLGTGNWGTVRTVRRRDDGKRFACKILQLSNEMSEDKLEELRTEINILAKMDHPYIAKLYEVYEDAGLHLYLIMELLQGGELYTKLTQVGVCVCCVRECEAMSQSLGAHASWFTVLLFLTGVNWIGLNKYPPV